MRLLSIMLLALFVLGTATSPSLAESFAETSFVANDSLWTVTLHTKENFDSDFVADMIDVKSDSGLPATIQPAWIGDDPGDLGPLWMIQDQDDSVLGACWSYYDSDSVECLPLYVPPTLSLD